MLRWIHASTRPPTSASKSAAGRVSIVEALSETKAQIGNFDDAIIAVDAGDFERAVEGAVCEDVAERAKTVSAVVIKEMWNE